MSFDWSRIRLAASVPTDNGQPTLAADVRIWPVTIEVHTPPHREDDLEYLARWLDDAFPGRTDLEWMEREEHDCPTCSCWRDDPVGTFTTKVAGRSRSHVESAVAALRVAHRLEVAV